jgi:hypothetical protein
LRLRYQSEASPDSARTKIIPSERRFVAAVSLLSTARDPLGSRHPRSGSAFFRASHGGWTRACEEDQRRLRSGVAITVLDGDPREQIGGSWFASEFPVPYDNDAP